MAYKGRIKNNVVVFEGETPLPDGTSVTIIPDEEQEDQAIRQAQWRRFNEGADRVFQRILTATGTTSDSAVLLQHLREERANR